MTQSNVFFVSFEQYIRQVVRRSPLPYSWIIAGFVCVVIVTSWLSRGESMTRTRTNEQAIRLAAVHGDYLLAQELFEQTNKNIEYRELEEVAYPEKKILTRITELEEKLTIYPGNRDIYKILANLYQQIGNQEKAREYSEQVRILDPNGENFNHTGE